MKEKFLQNVLAVSKRLNLFFNMVIKISVETIKREIEKRKSQHNKFFCQTNETSNENGTSYYDDYCNNACRTLQEPLPFGVIIEKVCENNADFKESTGYVFFSGSRNNFGFVLAISS